MLKFGNIILTNNNNWLNIPEHNVITSGNHGTVTASPNKGIQGTEVTLSNTPDTGYEFSSYSVTGATLKNDNQFNIGTTDVNVNGIFTGIVRSVTTTSSPIAGGSITASPNSGIIGTEVTLSNTPAEGYNFNGYVISGAMLSGNTFTIGESDVSVTGNFLEDIKYTVTCTNDGNGTIAASPTSNYSGSTVTLSNTPNSGYDFDSYTLISGTGASISGNILTIGTSNVTVRGNFARTVLPAGTIRVRTSDGQPPFKGAYTSYETATLVQGTSDIYDVYKSGTSFEYVLGGSGNVVEILDANTSNITNMQSAFSSCPLTSVPLFDTSNVTNMKYMFSGCTSLTSVPLFDTSNVTYMNCMFWGCTSLTSVPLFNTSKVRMMETMFSYCTSLTSVPLFDTSNNVNMAWMFNNCTSLTAVPLFDTSKVGNMQETFKNCSNVQSGALALYQQASTQANPPTNHKQTFYNCGSNTTTGAAELAQIPSDWK